MPCLIVATASAAPVSSNCPDLNPGASEFANDALIILKCEQNGTAAEFLKFDAGSITAPTRQLPVTESSGVLPPLIKACNDVPPSPTAMSNVPNGNDAGADYTRPLGLRYPDV